MPKATMRLHVDRLYNIQDPFNKISPDEVRRKTDAQASQSLVPSVARDV